MSNKITREQVAIDAEYLWTRLKLSDCSLTHDPVKRMLGYIAQLEQRNAELEAEKTKWVKHAEFYHKWATRTNVTDGERLSVIKHYPLTDEEIEAALAAKGE